MQIYIINEGIIMGVDEELLSEVKAMKNELSVKLDKVVLALTKLLDKMDGM